MSIINNMPNQVGGTNINGIIKDYYVYAGEKISANSFVEYVNGLAETKDYGESVDTQLSAETYTGYTISAVALDENRVFIAHSYGSNYYLYGMVVTINGTTITYGADTQLSSNQYTGYTISASLLPDGRVFIAHSYSSNYYLNYMLCTIQGDIITVNSEIQRYTTAYSGYRISVCTLPNGNVFSAFSWTANYRLYAETVTITDNTITGNGSTSVSYTNESGRAISTCLLSDGNVFVAHNSDASNYYLKGQICTISGTTITAGDARDTVIYEANRAGYFISVQLLPNGKVFIAHSFSATFRLYASIVTISGTTITTDCHIALSSTDQLASSKLSTCLLPNGNILITHIADGTNKGLNGIICSIDGATIIAGTDTQINVGQSSGSIATSLLLDNGTIFVAHSLDSSSFYLYAQIFGIDYDNNIPTNHIVLPEYETQVRNATSSKFDGIAKTSGKGAPEFVEGEITKKGNIFPTSGWSEVTAYAKYVSSGYTIEASSYHMSGTSPASSALDGNQSSCWQANAGTSDWFQITCPEPTKITKMKTHITCGYSSYLTKTLIQGSKDGLIWTNLCTLGSGQTTLTEITLNNADYYIYYKISTTLSNANYATMIYELQTSEYVELGQIPSTEHNEQVSIWTTPDVLSSLPVGALVKDVNSTFLGEPVIWKIADKNHEGYPDGSVTLISDKILALRAFDVTEPNNSNSDRQSYGNGRYSVSNIRQWLNSSAEAGQWYSAQHNADRAPYNDGTYTSYNNYEDDVGFLNGFSTNFKKSLLDTILTVALNTVTDGGGSETVVDKIFLASNTEVGVTDENNIAEGSLLSIFSDNTSRIAYCTTEAIEDSDYTKDPANDMTGWDWWLRTPSSSLANGVRHIYSNGNISSTNAYVGFYGVRPLCNISSSTLVSSEPDEDGCYILFKGGDAV